MASTVPVAVWPVFALGFASATVSVVAYHGLRKRLGIAFSSTRISDWGRMMSAVWGSNATLERLGAVRLVWTIRLSWLLSAVCIAAMAALYARPV